MSPKPITENTLFYGDNLTLEPPSEPMQKEAVTAGYYHSPGWNRDYPKIQIITVEEAMRGKRVEMPAEWGTFKQAPKADQPGAVQRELGL